MAYRLRRTALVVPIAGTTIAHGLPSTPDEYFIEYRGAIAGAVPNDMVHFSSTPADATNIYLTCGSTGTVDVIARVCHSIML